MGRYSIAPAEAMKLLFSGWSSGLSTSSEAELVFWNIRVPRLIMGLAVGSGISVAGVVFQALFRNPLAAPDILGVTQGSCFGAALAILFFTDQAIGVQGAAFVFGVLAVFAAHLLAARSRDRSASTLVISGIVVSALFQAGLSILMYVANPYDQLARIVFWIMGSLHVASWSKLETTVPVVLVGILVLFAFGWRLNVMTQNEEEALSLGVDVRKWRLLYITVSTLMVASCVAAVGTVLWLGLIVPHIARYLAGTEHRRLILVAAGLGGIFLLVMDTLARTLLPSEIPISIVTSLLGAPFLGYLAIYRKGYDLKGDDSD